MTYVATDAVLVSVEDAVATISLNRPERLNAWSAEISDGLLSALASAAHDSAVRGVIITGVGRAFSAGADLKNVDTHRVEHVEDYVQDHPKGPPIFDILSTYPKPVMAAVNGYSIGVGCLVPLCCDFVYAGESAKFQLPQVTLGILPAYGGALRLARAVGNLNAGEMILTGRMVSAKEAAAWGMVSRLVPDGELLQAAQAAMADIAKKPQIAVSLARESLRASVDSGNMREAELGDAYRYIVLAQTKDAARVHDAWRQGDRHN
jgi:enoyl-CoA hydratase/carnithine racemase